MKPRPRPWNVKARSRMGELGLTNKAVAERIGASATAVGTWLKGTHEPPLGMAVKLARALGLPLSWLLDDRVVGEPITAEMAQDLLQTLPPDGVEILNSLDDPRAVRVMVSALRAFQDVVGRESPPAQTDHRLPG